MSVICGVAYVADFSRRITHPRLCNLPAGHDGTHAHTCTTCVTPLRWGVLRPDTSTLRRRALAASIVTAPDDNTALAAARLALGRGLPRRDTGEALVAYVLRETPVERATTRDGRWVQ